MKDPDVGVAYAVLILALLSGLSIEQDCEAETVTLSHDRTCVLTYRDCGSQGFVLDSCVEMNEDDGDSEDQDGETGEGSED